MQPITCIPGARSSTPFCTCCEPVAAFRLLPHEFPAWQTVYYYFRRWQREGLWDQILRTLRMQVRRKQGREEEPSAAIIDTDVDKLSRAENLSPFFAFRPGLRASNRTS
ncbi:MAG: transposase [Ktedonobacteraceae bacterium]|nr:transposase [Ktedonobacteraceae bacterium]